MQSTARASYDKLRPCVQQLRQALAAHPIGLHAVADEGGHGHTTMLDLGVAEPADCLLESVLRLIKDP